MGKKDKKLKNMAKENGKQTPPAFNGLNQDISTPNVGDDGIEAGSNTIQPSNMSAPSDAPKEQANIGTPKQKKPSQGFMGKLLDKLCPSRVKYRETQQKLESCERNLAESKSSLDERSKKLSEVEIEKEELKSKLEQAESDFKALEERSIKKEANLNEQKEGVCNRLKDVQAQLSKTEKDLEDWTQEYARLQTDLDNQKESNKKSESEVLRQKTDEINKLNLLVGQKGSELKNAEQKLKELENAKTKLQNETEELGAQLAKAKKNYEELEKEKSAVETELAELKEAKPDAVRMVALQQENDDLKNEQDAKIEDARAEVRKQAEVEKQQLEATHQTEIKKLEKDQKNRIEELKRKRDERINEEKTKAEAAVKAAEDRAEADLKAERDRAADVLKRAKETAKNRLKDAEDKAARELQEVKDKAASELQAAKDRAAEDMKTLQATADERHAADLKIIEDTRAECRADKERMAMEHAKQTEQLEADLSRQRQRADKLYGHIRSTVKQGYADVLQLLQDANTAAAGTVVYKIMDDICHTNAIYPLDEYITSLNKYTDSHEFNTLEQLNEAMRPQYVELLQTQRPSWIDALMRLDSLLSVPFIADEWSRQGLDVGRVHRAAALTRSLLQLNGIELDVPRLFSDSFDAALHRSEPLKDISGQVTDIASHVQSAETIVDMFKAGSHTADRTLDVRPAVSRLNA